MAVTPTVSFSGDNANLGTNVGNFSVPKELYDKYLFQKKAAEFFKGNSTPDFAERSSAFGAGDTSALTQDEYNQIMGTAIPEGLDRAFFYQAADEASPGSPSSITDAIGVQAQQDAAGNRPWYRSAAKTIVPGAIASIGALLGGAALAPGVFGAGAGAGSAGLSTGAASATPSASALLAAPVGSPAGFSTSLIGAGSFGAGAGLGSVLGNFSLDAAKTGALKGAATGYQSDGLSGALKGAALGGATGAYGDALAGAAGLSGVGAEALKGGLTGASGGLATGDLGSAALGAALGGGSSYYNAGGNIPGLGTKVGSPLTGGLQGPTQGSGIIKDVTNSLQSSGLPVGGTSSLTGGGSMLGKLLNVGGSIYGQSQDNKANERILQGLQEAQQRATSVIDPYQQAGLSAQNQLSQALAQGFNPQDLESDPGYQFRLQEGMQGLQRQLGASGLGQSGAALKAAQQYGQGLASQEYGDAYNRWASQNAQLQNQATQGYGAAQDLGGLYGDLAGAQSVYQSQNQQNQNKTLSQLLGLFGG